MTAKVLIIQRFYYNFREGFFEYLEDINYNFNLINATESRGKVKVHDTVHDRKFIVKVFYFFIGQKYVVFPFLFFRLFLLNPETIVTEGGANTINNIAVYLFCRLRHRKYIVWDLGKAFANFGDSMGRKLYMRFYKSILRHADHVFGYNSQSKEYFISLGIPDSKIVILNNTIDTRKIKRIRSGVSPSVPAEVSELMNKGYTFIIFVGALVKSKNVELLAKLMQLLGQQYYALIIGEGTKEYMSILEKEFEGTNHLFLGYKKNDELLPYYSLASFAVLPGLGGLSINQSMAYGVPILCKSADGAEKDLVIPGQTGYIYENLDDARAFIVSQSAEDWKAMGLNAEKLLYERHSVESMMDTFISYL